MADHKLKLINKRVLELITLALADDFSRRKMNAGIITLIVAWIGFVGTIGAALIMRPRNPSAPQQPQSYSQYSQYSQSTWAPSNTHTAYDPPSGHAGARPAKISISLWLGLAGLILWLIPLLGVIDLVPGLFIAVRDLRSPGSRRHDVVGLILCLIASTLTIINSAVGAYIGYQHGLQYYTHG